MMLTNEELQNIRAVKAAKRIYIAHVKPLEDALAKAKADKAALVEALKNAESAMSLMKWRKDDALIAESLCKVCTALDSVKE